MKPRALLATAALLIATGCSSTPAQAAQVCVDRNTGIRLDDSVCEVNASTPNPVFIWWYITSGYTIPAYGWPVQYGYATPPRHTVVVHNVQSSGGVYPKVSRRNGNATPGVIKPTSAATQAPQPKKQSVWKRQPAQNQQKPPAQSRPQTQSRPASQPKWNTYKPPANPPAARPPTYSKYR